MPLVTTTEMFKKAYEGGYAVGAFNVNNMEIVQGIVDAAKEEQSPLILQVSAGARKYAKHIYLVKLVEAALEDSNLPIALHLDHGDSFEICKDCVDGGFTSVMIDASHHDFDENVKITKQVVEYAHAHGVVVEAELGRLAGVEDDVNVSDADARFTDPEQAAEFVHLTGVDSLAIAIGTSHGAYKFKGNPYLDFDRLKKVGELLPNFPIVLHGASSVLPEFVHLTGVDSLAIAIGTSHGAYKFKGDPYLDFDRLKKVGELLPDFPIVLHGASSVLPEFVAKCNEFGGNIPGAQGVPEAMLRQAAQMAVCKINIDTDLRLAMTASVREYLAQNPSEFDPRKYLGPARDAIKGMVAHKIKNVLGSSNTL